MSSRSYSSLFCTCLAGIQRSMERRQRVFTRLRAILQARCVFLYILTLHLPTCDSHPARTGATLGFLERENTALCNVFTAPTRTPPSPSSNAQSRSALTQHGGMRPLRHACCTPTVTPTEMGALIVNQRVFTPARNPRCSLCARCLDGSSRWTAICATGLQAAREAEAVAGAVV